MIFLFIMIIHIIIAIVMRINISYNIIIKRARRNVVIFFKKLEI